MNTTNIIAIVGMTGAGKSEAAEFFVSKNIDVVRFGAVIDDGIRKEGLPWTPENNVYYRKKIRQEYGMAAPAILSLPKIEAVLKEKQKVILDGLYSWEEYIFLKEKFPSLILLCIYAQPVIRYERLSNRPERKFSKADARRRDITEIEDVNKGGPIAISDYLIKNESSKENFLQELEKFYKLIIYDSN